MSYSLTVVPLRAQRTNANADWSCERTCMVRDICAGVCSFVVHRLTRLARRQRVATRDSRGQRDVAYNAATRTRHSECAADQRLRRWMHTSGEMKEPRSREVSREHREGDSTHTRLHTSKLHSLSVTAVTPALRADATVSMSMLCAAALAAQTYRPCMRSGARRQASIAGGGHQRRDGRNDTRVAHSKTAAGAAMGGNNIHAACLVRGLARL